MEFDDFSVKSEQDLVREVRPDEEIDVLLRANDEDENLSHLILRDRRGDEVASLECLESQLSQCTGRLKITAPDRSDKTVEFSAVAVDRRQEESAPILLTIITKKKSAGGGGGGGGSPSSKSTPTPVPLPVVSLEKGQTTVGGTITLALTINKVPNGLSGFDVFVTVADPTVATITGVTFPQEFGVNNELSLAFPALEIRLVGVDIAPGSFERQVNPGDTDVLLVSIELEGVKQGTTAITLFAGAGNVEPQFMDPYLALGFQDEEANQFKVTITNGELTIVP